VIASYDLETRSRSHITEEGPALREDDVLAMAEDIRRAMGLADEFSVSVLHVAWEERVAKAVEESGLLRSEGEALKRYIRGTKLSRVDELSLRLQDKLFDNIPDKARGLDPARR
jgi:hypothetical protein